MDNATGNFSTTSTSFTETPASIDLTPGTWDIDWRVRADGPGEFCLYARTPEDHLPAGLGTIDSDFTGDLQWHQQTVRYKVDEPTTLVIWVRALRWDLAVLFPHWTISATPASDPLPWDGWPLGEPT